MSSNELETLLESLREELDSEKVTEKDDLLERVNLLIERNEILMKRARGIWLSILERERESLERLRDAIRRVKAAKALIATLKSSPNLLSHEQLGELPRASKRGETGSFVLIEATRDFVNEEFGAVRKGDILATTKERAEQLREGGVAKIVGVVNESSESDKDVLPEVQEAHRARRFAVQEG